MNDHLDSLIRGSLDHHAPAEPPDADLAGRVASLGRRRRASQRTGLAALAVVAVAGAAWGITSLPPGTTQVATAPTAPPTSNQTVTPSASAAPAGAVKDIAALTQSDFASPTGNILCSLRPADGTEDWERARVFCTLVTADAGVFPTKEEACGPDSDVPVAGVELTAEGAARWACAGDAQVFPYLDAGDVASWWDVDFATTTPAPFDPAQTMVVLPYDKTLVGGDFTCAMDTDGVTCTNTATGHGFDLNRSGAELR